MKPSNDKEAITLILDGLREAGVKVTDVCDDTWNRDELTPVDDIDVAVSLITGVDEAVAYFDLPNGQTSFIYFVLGNDPEEVACDHGVNLSEYIDPIVNPWWE